MDSLTEHRAAGEFLATTVEQIAEVQRFATRQLQAGQAQGLFTAGDDQAVFAGAEDFTWRTAACG
ncbi:hypothetical protein D3C72_1980700 [compost metagenome]